MYLCDAYFFPCSLSRKDFEELEFAVHGFMASLLKNGNTYKEYVIGWRADSIRATFRIPEKSALSKKYFSGWIKDDLKKVLKSSSKPQRYEVTFDQNPRGKVGDLTKSTCLLFYTDQFEIESPVHSSETGCAIPLYRLPLSQSEREEIFFWQERYHDLNSIWFASSFLEIEAYRELADPRSEFSKWGSTICKKIEKATKKSVYYYLKRYWGRKKNEENRPCPGCGKKWILDINDKTYIGLANFYFMCKSCRFVSTIGNEYEDENHAKIGEYG